MNKKMLWVVIALVAIAVVTVPVAACDYAGGCGLTAGGHIRDQNGIRADSKGSYGGNGNDHERRGCPGVSGITSII